MRQQLGFRTRPLKFSTTAPGPPTHAKHSDRKLYITQASYLKQKLESQNINSWCNMLQDVPRNSTTKTKWMQSTIVSHKMAVIVGNEENNMIIIWLKLKWGTKMDVREYKGLIRNENIKIHTKTVKHNERDGNNQAAWLSSRS